MAGIQMGTFATPDETRPFVDKGAAEVLDIGGRTVLKGRFEPGWRWSDHVRPIAGTDSCEFLHFVYILSGRMHVAMNGGEEGDVGPDSVVRIEPGHDAWVVGDEPCVLVDFGVATAYAQRRPAEGQTEQRQEAGQ